MMLPVMNGHDSSITLAAGKVPSRCVLTNSPVLQVRTEREPVSRGELNIGNDVSDETANELIELLNSYRCTIAEDIYEIGCTDLVTMDTTAITNYPVPAEKHTIRRYIGVTSFIRKFIPAFTVKAEPLTRMLKKDATFSWGKE